MADVVKRRADEVEGDGESVPRPVARKETKVEMDIDFLLKEYYTLFFPYKKFYRWLSYGNLSKNYYANREFSFTLKDDVYVRYLSFNSDADLRAELTKKVPHKIDIGAVYNAKPKDHKTMRPGAFQPVEKELVFDIDMTDYDDVRTCCKEANVCQKCWKYMTVAIEILDRALRDDFGFQNLLWVFSGRRGVHCWVCDERARKLSNEGRTAIADYLSVVKGGEQQAKKVQFMGQMHPSLLRAHTTLAKYFDTIVLREQNLLASDPGQVLEAIPDHEMREALRVKWNASAMKSSDARWRDIRSKLAEILNSKPLHSLRNLEQELMFQLCYPRLDVNVSKQVNHLLKSPFCVHPKTGRVCVPIDPAHASQFDPTTVPTVMDLLEERDRYDRSHATDAMEANEEQRGLSEYKKTSLSPYMDTFTSFLNRLDEKHRAGRAKQQDESMTF